ncbi:VCBS repeat-containing protein [Streptomyces sp. HPF1205]|uniref:FG-GAP repeat domain-containing protein n=1 Tax=Streptomyces sp. HPF1205 TaxID=2873262 RepID=UPI001CED24FA|nr:VCBS repeat-containing protein [Streptomyces sp. HPF1205]
MSRTTALRHGLVAALAAVAAAVGPLPPLAHADTAPVEVTIPTATHAGPAGEPVYRAGATGYLIRSTTASGQFDDVWHGYDGTDRHFGDITLARLMDDGHGPVLIGALPSGGPLQIYDVATGSRTDYAFPSGEKPLGVFPTSSGWVGVSETAVLAADGTTTGYTLHLLTPGTDGTFVRDAVISGQPASGVKNPAWRVARGEVVIGYLSGIERRVGLIDTDNATLAWSTAADVGSTDLVLGHGYFGYLVDGTVTVRAVTDPSEVVRDIAIGGSPSNLAFTGDALLTAPGVGGIQSPAHEPLLSYPLAGGPATALNGDAGMLLQSDGGGYVFDAATGDGSYGSYKVGPDGGTPQLLRTYPTYQPRSIGLSLSGGELTRVETAPGTPPQAEASSFTIGEDQVPTGPTSTADEGTEPLSGVTECGEGNPCMPLTASYRYPGRVTLIRDASGDDHLVNGLPPYSVLDVDLHSSGGRIVSAGLHHVLYDSGSGGSAGEQSVIDLATRHVIATRPTVAAALWGETLWSATATPGVLTAADAATGANPRTVTTDAPCVPDEIQVLGRWVYWSCAAAGPAGVWDSTTGQSVRVGAGPALLGDGFVLRHTEGALVLTDVHTGTARDRTIAALPAGPYADDRNITWTVDKYRGFIAYTDTSLTTHVLAPGVPYSPLAILADQVPATVTAGPLAWEPRWQLTGPARWQVDLRRKGSSTAVWTQPAASDLLEQDVYGEWDGHGADGRVLPNGAYTWTLTAWPANGQGPAVVTSGTVMLNGGASDARDYTGDGVGDLLALTSAGRLDVRPGTGSAPGGVRAASASGTGWPASSTAVPIGDLSGDGIADLLVRDASGRLNRYDGTNGQSFAPSSPSRLVGSGWNVYNSLAGAGDLNGDGRPDLVARDSSGVLYFYAGNAAGVFAGRVRIGGGWQIYTALIAGQDLNGDGIGDLLARDTAGVLWRYDGNGNGGFHSRMRIGGGWNTYNSLVGVSDLNGDGRADLLARDANGDLWRYNGEGNGLFAPRAKIGWGWQTYRTLL